ncbi:hypothetical protein GYMLUDRAFT_253194 [Collybiopsis luxurians FD-317 M1]|uniref:Uncharacterized protein n=1 Tax=Collybiopsis luxurians FD-317 M1 TaxID=944289 RepID=A0A0D0C649_9AGAR|nr:hypothetical protein GYMLUDRAFT_253194 [Collybiopsis luxurians FD-317 M1]
MTPFCLHFARIVRHIYANIDTQDITTCKDFAPTQPWPTHTHSNSTSLTHRPTATPAPALIFVQPTFRSPPPTAAQHHYRPRPTPPLLFPLISIADKQDIHRILQTPPKLFHMSLLDRIRIPAGMQPEFSTESIVGLWRGKIQEGLGKEVGVGEQRWVGVELGKDAGEGTEREGVPWFDMGDNSTWLGNRSFDANDDPSSTPLDVAGGVSSGLLVFPPPYYDSNLDPDNNDSDDDVDGDGNDGCLCRRRCFRRRYHSYCTSLITPSSGCPNSRPLIARTVKNDLFDYPRAFHHPFTVVQMPGGWNGEDDFEVGEGKEPVGRGGVRGLTTLLLCSFTPSPSIKRREAGTDKGREDDLK